MRKIENPFIFFTIDRYGNGTGSENSSLEVEIDAHYPTLSIPLAADDRATQAARSISSHCYSHGTPFTNMV